MQELEYQMSGRRVGRPARVTRTMIARAAYEIGLSELTMRAVADRLGVSSTSLYYHVRDREDLTRMVAEYSAEQLVPPRDQGQHWTRWLLEWAQFTRAAFVGQPGLLEQFLNGTIELERMLPNIDRVIGVLEREGFDPDDAMRAYSLVSDVAVGSAVTELRRGGSLTNQSVREASVSRSGRFVHLEKVSVGAIDSDRLFREQICTVLVGIGVTRGDDPSDVTSWLAEEPQEALAVEVFHP